MNLHMFLYNGVHEYISFHIKWKGIGSQVLTTLESALPLQIFINNNTITNNVIYIDIARPLMCEPLRHECYSIVRHTSILVQYMYKR